MTLTKLAPDHAAPTARAAFADAVSGGSPPAPAADLSARAGLRRAQPQVNRMRSSRLWSAGLLRVQSQANRTNSSRSWLAGLLRTQPQVALPLLERARALAFAHPAPVIARYRFHFYGHALPPTRAVGGDALVIGLLRVQPQANWIRSSRSWLTGLLRARPQADRTRSSRSWPTGFRARSSRSWLAGLLRAQPQAALPLLERARSLAFAHPAPVIARYRFHFYGHALPPTRAVGEDAPVMTCGALGAPFGTASFDAAPLAVALFPAALFTNAAARYDAAARFYLFTLKSLTCLDVRLLRLGEGACPRPPAGLRWAAIGMGWRPMSRRIGGCPCKRFDRPIARSRPNPERQRFSPVVCGVAALAYGSTMCRAPRLPLIPKRPPRGLPGDREQALITTQRWLAGLRRLNPQDHAGDTLPQHARSRHLAGGSLMATPNPVKRRAHTRRAAGWRGRFEVMAPALATALAFPALAAFPANVQTRHPAYSRAHRITVRYSLAGLLARLCPIAAMANTRRCVRIPCVAGQQGRANAMTAALAIVPACLRLWPGLRTTFLFPRRTTPDAPPHVRACGRHRRASLVGRATHPIAAPACEYRSLRARPAGRGFEHDCELGHACVQDAYTRRIERFSRWHSDLADRQLARPYFKVRAIAARYASVFRLPSLIGDPDEIVRPQIVLRLPLVQLARLARDPEREVRIGVAQRIEDDALIAMRGDPDYGARERVAPRLPEAPLSTMERDPDRSERVAQRLRMSALPRMTGDDAAQVHSIVARRLPAALLKRMADDADWHVCWKVARHGARALSSRLASDADAAARRLGQQARKARETRSLMMWAIRPAQSVQPIQEGGHV